MIHITYPWLKAYKRLADTEDEHSIGIKGEGRKEAVEILKAKGMIAHGLSPIYLGQAPQQEPQKRRFWQRKPKEENPYE